MDITKVYVERPYPHWEIGIWDDAGEVRIKSFSCEHDAFVEYGAYKRDEWRRIRKVVAERRNEDTEYSAEYTLYIEETMKVLHPIGHKPDFVTADWRYSDAFHSFAFGADFVTYRRFLLIDADRIEAQ